LLRKKQIPFVIGRAPFREFFQWCRGAAIFLLLTVSQGIAQATPEPPSLSQDKTSQNATPKGRVLFSRGAASEADGKADGNSQAAQQASQGLIAPVVTDAERDALTIISYDLDMHLKPATAGLATRVAMTVRNDGTVALTRLVLQISSTLRWESFSNGARGRLEFATETVETDADHTGFVSEAVVRLAEPLAPGGTYELAGIYSGTIERSAVRLDRIGAPADQARLADWDEIGLDGVALRGFGEVLWYPVAAKPVFLGNGATFFEAVGQARGRIAKSKGRLRLAVEYVGEAPHSAYFCGRLERMTAHSENQDVPVDESPGIATAEFAPEAFGFGTPSLFVTQKPETLGGGGLMTAVTENEAAFQSYVSAGQMVQPMLADWYGAAGPAEPLRIIDHLGQPFVEGSLAVAQMRVEEPGALAPEIADGLSHAWLRSGLPWIEEGLAQFFRLLWMERAEGRERAVKELESDAVPLALVEPAAVPLESSARGGQSLVDARDEIYARTKAAAVWWMLRSIMGDDSLKQGLRSYRRDARASEDPKLLERVLSQKAGVSLAWFFDDWVYADKGLPDLSIVQVTPRELPAKGGKGQGWLVAVSVRNDGDAVAEVPVTVRSGTLTTTERLRIAGRSSASTRILFEKTPEEVQVNDGEVPEVRTSSHTRRISVTEQ
jgi:hypothetical protein